MSKDLAMLLSLSLACAAAACATPHHAQQQRSDFSVLELSPAQHDVHRSGEWLPGEAGTLPPEGATAKCSDGHYSFAQQRRSACARHGGVEKWLQTI